MGKRHKRGDLETAIGHESRRQILRRLRVVGVASTSRLSKDLGIEFANVGYHIRVLRKCGVVSVAETQPRRGLLECLYELVSLPPWVWKELELAAGEGDKESMK